MARSFQACEVVVRRSLLARKRRPDSIRVFLLCNHAHRTQQAALNCARRLSLV